MPTRARRLAAEFHGLPRTISSLKRGLVAAAVLVVALPAAAPARPAPPQAGIEVVVTMKAPALAELPSRSLASGSGSARRLSLRSPRSVAYRHELQAAQRTLAARIERAIPAADVRWHYSVVVNGLAVVAPAGDISRLMRIPGVAKVWPSVTYHPMLDRTPRLIGAPTLWGPTLATAGNGMKIAIVDQGIDQRHPFFDPAGLAYPPGFPKGNTAYTTPKIWWTP